MRKGRGGRFGKCPETSIRVQGKLLACCVLCAVPQQPSFVDFFLLSGSEKRLGRAPAPWCRITPTLLHHHHLVHPPCTYSCRFTQQVFGRLTAKHTCKGCKGHEGVKILASPPPVGPRCMHQQVWAKDQKNKANLPLVCLMNQTLRTGCLCMCGVAGMGI